jgi:creatinine amidohydrolase
MYLMNMNSVAFKNAVNSGVRTVLIPVGVLEAHGEHLPLGTDTLIPREFARRLEEEVGDKIMIAPDIPYGHSWATAMYPGTLDLPNHIFEDYVTAVGEQFIKQGLPYIILFNGHNGNIPALSVASEKLVELGAVVFTINWWLDYQKLIVKYAPGVGHAGEDETSCMLAMDPSLVDMSLAHDSKPALSRSIKFKDMGLELYPYGNNGDATKGTAEKGEHIFNELIPAMLKDIETMWSRKSVAGTVGEPVTK